MGAQVAIGEVAVMAALGLPLLAILSKPGVSAKLFYGNRTTAQARGGPEL